MQAQTRRGLIPRPPYLRLQGLRAAAALDRLPELQPPSSRPPLDKRKDHPKVAPACVLGETSTDQILRRTRRRRQQVALVEVADLGYLRASGQHLVQLPRPLHGGAVADRG